MGEGPTERDSRSTSRLVPIVLRAVEPEDLPVLYSFQTDEEANRMAVARPRSREDFEAHWTRVLVDPDVFVRAITCERQLVGTVTCFPLERKHWVGYWVGKPYWRQGIATQAVSRMLIEVSRRPLFARVATSNVASCRVVERCGFVAIGTSQSPETDRFPACEETMYRLGAPGSI